MSLFLLLKWEGILSNIGIGITGLKIPPYNILNMEWLKFYRSFPLVMFYHKLLYFFFSFYYWFYQFLNIFKRARSILSISHSMDRQRSSNTNLLVITDAISVNVSGFFNHSSTVCKILVNLGLFNRSLFQHCNIISWMTFGHS